MNICFLKNFDILSMKVSVKFLRNQIKTAELFPLGTSLHQASEKLQRSVRPVLSKPLATSAPVNLNLIH